MMFRHAANLIDDTARHQTKISRIQRQRSIRQHRLKAIKEQVTQLYWPAFPPGSSRGINDVVSIAIMVHENRNRLGHILQIAIPQHNGVTDRAVESSAERRLMSESAGKSNDKDAGICLDGLLEDLLGSI